MSVYVLKVLSSEGRSVFRIFRLYDFPDFYASRRPSLLPQAFVSTVFFLRPCYQFRFPNGGQGFVAVPERMVEQDPIVGCSEDKC